MPVRNQRGVAKWVKILLWTTVILLVLSLATCTIGGLFLFKSATDATDPKKIAPILDSMVSMTTPLPDKFKLQMAVDMYDLMKVKFACLKNKDATLEFYIVRFKNSEKTEYTAQQFIDEMANNKKTIASAGAASEAMKGFVVKEKGSMQVAGVDMPIAIGTTENEVSQIKRPALFGCIVPDKTNIQLICAFGPEGKEELDKKSVSEFFDLIKAVK
jgi:hypothetical protein